MFQAIHDGRPDQSLLAYQYLQMMPKIAEGDANKVWIVPSEIGKALEGLGSTMTDLAGIPKEVEGPRTRVDMGPTEPQLPRSGRDDAELTPDQQGGRGRHRGGQGRREPGRRPGRAAGPPAAPPVEPEAPGPEAPPAQ